MKLKKENGEGRHKQTFRTFLYRLLQVFCMNSAEMCHERLLTKLPQPRENQNVLKTSLRYLCTSWMSKKRL